MNHKTDNLLLSNRGETLIEMIISIAIFSIMVGLLTVSYSVSQNVLLGNFETRNDMNAKIIFVNEATPENAAEKGLEVSASNTKITWQVDGGTVYSFYVTTIKDKDHTIEKYVNVEAE